MDNHVKNQHFVPRFLLSNFSSKTDKFIWAYDNYPVYNPKDKIKERAIRKVANEDYFYDEIKGYKEGSFEYILQKIEDITAPIILKIIETRKIESLSKFDREIVSLFVTLQILRTKNELEQTEHFMDVLSKQLKEKANIITEKVDSRKIWFYILKDSFDFHKVIENKVWHLTESNNSFYISDNPVTLQNTTDKSEIRGTLGIDSYGIEIHLPISPSLTICFFCEKLFQEKGYDKNYIPKTICQPENIENLNWLQIIHSQRFIFSHKNNFEFVDKIKNAQ
jgi:hypothetical protein